MKANNIKYIVISLLVIFAVGVYCFKVFSHNDLGVKEIPVIIVDEPVALDYIKNPKDYEDVCVTILEKYSVTEEENEKIEGCVRKIFDKLEKGEYRIEGFSNNGVIQKEDVAKWYKQSSYNIGVVEYKKKKTILKKDINYINNEIQKYAD